MNLRDVKRAAATAVLSSLMSLAVIPGAARSADALRPDVAKPLNDAQNLYRSHNYRGALDRIAQAASVPGKSAYETRVVEEMQGAAAIAGGNLAVAAQAYEALLSSGQLDSPGVQQFSAALAGVYFQQKNYAAAIRSAQRYDKSGGTDPQMRELLVQSYFLAGDCGNVVTALKPGIDAALQSGRVPVESQLQLLAQCGQKTQNAAAQSEALAALVAYYPTPAYQQRLFDAVRSKPGYLASLDLDIYRLRRATGTLTSSDQFMEMTQLSLIAGVPAEARQVIDQGFASGLLGHDAQAERERRLQALVARRLQGQTDGNNLPVDAVDGALNHVYAGQPQQGIDGINSAIAKGAAHPDAARLRLGEAYYYAGQKARAAQVFRSVKGDDGSADLARLWALVADKKGG